MAGRTFAVGDVHGDLDALEKVLSRLPELDADDTMVFLGDYVDRGPCSAQVVEFVREGLPNRIPAKIVALKGNHEDGWLGVAQGKWPQFVIPVPNGCLATLRSYNGGPPPDAKDHANRDEFNTMMEASFFPVEVLNWMRNLPAWYEDDHAIYVHAGLVRDGQGKWLHPRDVRDPRQLIWTRSRAFYTSYEGKRVVVGHTPTNNLPPELDNFTPDDQADIWGHDNVLAIDTGAGKAGFLTILELPSLTVYESR